MTEQKEVDPSLNTVNNYILYLKDEIKKRDKMIKEESDISSELSRYLTEAREDVKKVESTTLKINICYFLVFLVANIIYWGLIK